jgi:MFS family permease
LTRPVSAPKRLAIDAVPVIRSRPLMEELTPTALTYRYERRRALASGILETAGTTFLLLIVVRHFQAGPLSKALVAGGGSLGLILTPWVVSLTGQVGWTAARSAATLCLVGAAFLLLMMAAPVLPIFVGGSMLAMAATAAIVPLMTHIYQENYPEAIRGRLFSRTIMIRIGAAAVFSQVAGQLFARRLDCFQWLLLLFALAFVFSGYCLYYCPSSAIAWNRKSRVATSWKYIKEDRLFRYTLICWMLMGFANLMMFPLRVEYLANSRYGLALTVDEIALYVGVVPNLVRLILSPAWGWMFDHINFFLLRVALNLGFAVGILAFFLNQSAWGLLLGAVLFGASLAGGDVAWSLWVTKFAPPKRVADYMAIHTFFTGLRGVIAPAVAFQALTSCSIQTLGWVSAGLIVLASLMLVPEIKWDRKVTPATVLVEEVSE